MSLSTVLFLFLAHLGVGIVVTLLFVARDAGVKFFRFNAGLAAILLVIALAFYVQSVRTLAVRTYDGSNLSALHVTIAADVLPLVLSTVLTVFWWATIGRRFTRFRTPILAVAAVAGVAAVVLQALEIFSGASPTLAALAVASFLTSSLLLGGACTAMILGHWYLVIPSM